MKKFTFFLVATLAFFSACDVIDDPIIPFTVGYQESVYGPPPTFGPPSTTLKNVLLEDFTAHQCGNCPDAGVIADNILAANPGRVAVVAIHAGNLAVFSDTPPFDTDWTTEEGNFFWDQLDFQANPLGRINRTGGPGNFFSPSEWSSKVNEILLETADLNMQMELNYVEENNHLNIHVHGRFANGYNNSTNLALLIIESELYDYQLWYNQNPSTIPDYHFKHTLRGSVTGPQGLQFSPTNASAGDTFRRDYTFTWNNDWNIEHSAVVAIIYDPITGEALNSVEMHP